MIVASRQIISACAVLPFGPGIAIFFSKPKARW
jgi:hypothetical protein